MYLDHSADYRVGGLLNAPLQVSPESRGPVPEEDRDVLLPGPGLGDFSLLAAVFLTLLGKEILQQTLKDILENERRLGRRQQNFMT